MDIAILVATYNGEYRLPILLQSLENQTNKDWKIYVHDDGSTDATLNILEEYKKKYPDNFFVLGADVNHLGARDNFMWLLNHVEADYYMFCDEDDKWFPNKVDDSLNFLQQLEAENPGRPVCIHTDLAVCDSLYNKTHDSLWKLSRVIPSWQETPEHLLIANCVTGCTMMFNHKVKELALNMPDYVPMHDFWVAFETMKEGGVLSHLNKATMLYCQHGDNEVGANTVNAGYVARKILGIKNVFIANCDQYKLAKRLSGMGVVRFLWLKLVFELKR